jgi:anti-sigma regulatory factor (Ser/Thr protein kinase)
VWTHWARRTGRAGCAPAVRYVHVKRPTDQRAARAITARDARARSRLGRGYDRGAGGSVRGAVCRGESPGMSPPVLVRRYRARAEEIGQIRHDVKAHARDQGARNPDAIALAVTEAVTNAVLHAYVDAAEPGEVEVIVQRVGDDCVEIVVCDEGRGMRPRTDSPGLGLGLPLVATLAEHFEVQARDGGGTRVRMAFAAG